MMGKYLLVLRISRNAVRPSISGISISKVMTSGEYVLIASMACRPLLAKPTTSMAGSFCNALAIILRITAESSTMRTRTLSKTT